MAFTQTITGIVTDADGKVRIRFGKIEKEFASLAAVQQFAREQLDVDDMQAIAIALMIARQPNLNNPAVFVGHSVVVDFTLANWGTIS